LSFRVAFPPVAEADARILILGSLPGVESLRLGQYYAHPRNAFWRIMGELAGAAPDLPYDQRLPKLTGAGFALWDVCASATRPGSLDAAISDVTPNDFAGFLDAHRQIALICFNGQQAAKLFERHVAAGLPERARGIHRKALPSTSPAHAGMRFEQKLALWRDAFTLLAQPS
jgi:double-stranded uracil-DNA glycosylase